MSVNLCEAILLNAPKRVLKTRRLLGEVLLELGLVTDEQIKAAVAEGQRLGVRAGQILTEKGLVTETDLAKAVAKQYSLEYIDLRGVEPERSALDLIPHAVAARGPVFPGTLSVLCFVIATANRSILVIVSFIA